MPYYIRKVDKATWLKTDPSTNDVAADAITNCLNTKQNQLSFWKIEKLEDALINEVIKAIICSFTSGLDTFDIVILEESELPKEIKNIQTPPISPYVVMKDNHYDFTELTLSKLSSLSLLIYQKLKINNERRITRGIGKGLLRKIIEDNPSIKEKLHETLTRSI